MKLYCFIPAESARTSKVVSADGQGTIDVGLGYTLLGPELQEPYLFFENLILSGVAFSGVCVSMGETENCIKNNFKGDICGIAILGDHHIMGGKFIIKGRVAFITGGC